MRRAGDPQRELHLIPRNKVGQELSPIFSKENLETAKSSGVKDVMFAKKRGLRLLDMVKSLWVY